jgi:hypothetical protein
MACTCLAQGPGSVAGSGRNNHRYARARRPARASNPRATNLATLVASPATTHSGRWAPSDPSFADPARVHVRRPRAPASEPWLHGQGKVLEPAGEVEGEETTRAERCDIGLHRFATEKVSGHRIGGEGIEDEDLLTHRRGVSIRALRSATPISTAPATGGRPGAC